MTTTPDSIIEILEDFAENLASASEEDNFAQLNKVVTDSVNEAKASLIHLIEVERAEAKIILLNSLKTYSLQVDTTVGDMTRVISNFQDPEIAKLKALGGGDE